MRCVDPGEVRTDSDSGLHPTAILASLPYVMIDLTLPMKKHPCMHPLSERTHKKNVSKGWGYPSYFLSLINVLDTPVTATSSVVTYEST